MQCNHFCHFQVNKQFLSKNRNLRTGPDFLHLSVQLGSPENVSRVSRMRARGKRLVLFCHRLILALPKNILLPLHTGLCWTVPAAALKKINGLPLGRVSIFIFHLYRRGSHNKLNLWAYESEFRGFPDLIRCTHCNGGGKNQNRERVLLPA